MTVTVPPIVVVAVSMPPIVVVAVSMPPVTVSVTAFFSTVSAFFVFCERRMVIERRGDTVWELFYLLSLLS
jgi:hypothetical protein